MLSPRLQLLHDSLQKLMRRDATRHVERLLKRARPADVAEVLRLLLDRQRRRVFDLLPNDECRADVLTEVDDHLVARLVEERTALELLAIVEFMGGDDQVDFIAALPEVQREALLKVLAPDEVEEVEDLLHYDPETAGGIMSPDFFALDEDTTAADGIAALRLHHEEVEMAFYIYATSESGHLTGVVSLRALVTHSPETPLSQMMASDIISVTTGTDQEEVAMLAARYNLLAVPVVDQSSRLVGIVTIDDVIDIIREEATEDMLKMTGADESAFEDYSIIKNFKHRAPWLFATWLGGLAASILIGMFEGALESRVALAAFIPIVLGMGGNVGTQTATIMVRGLATGKVSSEVGTRYLVRETIIGVMMGLLYGGLLAVYAGFKYGGDGEVFWHLPLVVAISILVSMVTAAAVGSITPLLFDRLNIDPAVATGPVVTTTVDVLGILTYFITASLVFGHL